MINRPVFRDHKLPVARAKGGIPLFLDFSLGCYPGESLLPQFINETVSKTANVIDGILLCPQYLHDVSPMNNKEVWVRAGPATDSNLANSGKNETAISSFFNAHYLSQNAVSGIVGGLVLGCSASDEADNIQVLAFLRTLSVELGISLAVDIHVIDQRDDEGIFLEIVELGLNLAVELGGNIMIVPGGGYLSAKNHIDQITDLPLFIKQPISHALKENNSPETLNGINGKLNGVLLTDLDHWEQKDIDPEKLNRWAHSLCSKELESDL